MMSVWHLPTYASLVVRKVKTKIAWYDSKVGGVSLGVERRPWEKATSGKLKAAYGWVLVEHFDNGLTGVAGEGGTCGLIRRTAP